MVLGTLVGQSASCLCFQCVHNSFPFSTHYPRTYNHGFLEFFRMALAPGQCNTFAGQVAVLRKRVVDSRIDKLSNVESLKAKSCEQVSFD